jgi:hypothetical protein
MGRTLFSTLEARYIIDPGVRVSEISVVNSRAIVLSTSIASTERDA